MAAVSAVVPRRKLGTQGLEVSALGLGCSGLSGAYGSYTSEEDTIFLFQHAFNRGITFFDTADMYGYFANEILVGKGLKHLPRDKIQLATKFGLVMKDDSSMEIVGTAEYVRKACEASLERLDVEYIDLYYQHRADKRVPIEETVGEMKKLVEEGKVKYIGLCEVSVDTLRRAHAVHPITAVQYEWSLWSRELENEIIPTCRVIIPGFNQRIWQKTKFYLTVFHTLRTRINARQHNLHWHGFFKGMMLFQFQEQPKSRI